MITAKKVTFSHSYFHYKFQKNLFLLFIIEKILFGSQKGSIKQQITKYSLNFTFYKVNLPAASAFTVLNISNNCSGI